MGKLITGTAICAALCAGSALAAAAPVRAIGADSPLDQGPQTQQIYLRETQQVTARAQLIYKLADNDPAAEAGAVEGRAEVVEHSQGLVVYDPPATPAAGAKSGLADPQLRPASPVRTTTTATVSWTPAPALPTPRHF